ncbi:25S rRNA -methyltransferase [Golovinomyces cichoracearum]|uniref:25S rRNA-methyltransferase n=1 Tax=Golovinomyces cichoracearum TaxID=62708 RepID=A0A420HBQ6_9PEZI|nr:25S rRNA -methyltransferase [Golovinomyces cichoracearum]
MGKNGRSNKSSGKITRDSFSQTGPPKNTKKVETRSKPKPNLNTADSLNLSDEPDGSISLQQELLNHFKTALRSTLTVECLQKKLQDVKEALYERDFDRAFGTQQNLEIYAIRWSPSRALCYRTILADIRPYLIDILPNFNLKNFDINHMTKDSHQSQGKVVCFGGCAAEAVAFYSIFRYVKDDAFQQKEDYCIPKSLDDQPKLVSTDSTFEICLVDCAQWQNIVHKLSDTLINSASPLMEKEGVISQSGQTSLKPLDIRINFFQEDILTMNLSKMMNIVGQDAILVTLLFTLNELYASSTSMTTKFLLNLTATLKPGSILLVVDSPGSYSETRIGSGTKKYPISWLIDYCLLSESSKISEDTSPKWIKLLSEESKWFRIPEALDYPIQLENMRYQMHLYRRV